MKRTGKIAGMLAAGALAGSLSMGVSGSARADVIPPTPDQGWAEIFTPFTSSTTCLDDPGGSTTQYTPIQVFHCHGYASNGSPQRWNFALWGNVSPGVTLFRLTTQAGLCVGSNGTAGQEAGARVVLRVCSGWFLGPLWELLSRNAYAGDPVFELELGTTGDCMTLPDWSGRNGEPIVLEPCDFGAPLQFWNLG